MSEAKNKGGRPRKYPEGARSTFTFRLPLSLRVRLVEASEEKGRSLSEEIERIIEQHYAGLDTRTMIREEIRATLDDATVFVYRDAAASTLNAASPRSLNQIHDRSALNGKQ